MTEKAAEVLSIGGDAKPKNEGDGVTLGAFLASARERRGASLAEALTETRIPDHYLRMMESNDYSMISDQLYVLPFLRRYASFLKIDPDEVVMRFVREVQRADNAPPTRAIEPIDMDPPKRRNWTKPAIAAALIGTIVAAWVVQSRHRRAVADLPVGAVSEQTSSSR